jgi:nitronate monooxygenase
MWPRTDLLDLLQIDHPIVQAPMAGSTTPELAAAVSNAGALGSLGCGSMPAAGLRAEIAALRSATNRSFNLNFFAHPVSKKDDAVAARTRARLKPFYEERGLGEVPSVGRAPFEPFGAEALAILLEEPPRVVSFHFGLPEPEMVAALKDAGCAILCSATSVAEAKMLAAAGVDAIIAQGWEAGGHRGAFDVTLEDVGIGTLALVPQIVDAVDVPVIAAGGIADGRGIAAAFALGASGVQIGTAFLSCPEARVSDLHRAAMRNASDHDTRLTRAYSGRPARAKTNRYVEAMAEQREPLPDFPLMFPMIDPLLQHDAASADPQIQFLLYGQATPLNREAPAARLVETLVEEAQSILRR